jgi:hypothetical protein
VAFALIARYVERGPPNSVAASTSESSLAAPGAARVSAGGSKNEAPRPTAASATPTATTSATGAVSAATVELDLPLGARDTVLPGQGLLEVTAGASDAIYVDGQLVGRGAVSRVPLAAKASPYEVRVKLRGEERVRYVTIKDGRLARVRVAPPWSR